MSARENNREWLTDGATRRPDGWEAIMIDEFGIEGALDVLAAQAGNVEEINLTHRPWAANPQLKAIVRAARSARAELSSVAHERTWEAVDRRRRLLQ